MAVKRFAIGLSKVVLGVFLALGIIGLAGVAAAKYFLTQLTHLPERPVYANDASAPPEAEAAVPESDPPADPAATAEIPPETAEETDAEETDTEETDTEETATPDPNALYDVTVVYPSGLLVRSGPGAEYGQLGGVDSQAQLSVLEESNGWLRVRSTTGQEGWVKGGGNVQRVE